MSVSKMSKEDRRRRIQTQNQILTSVGCLFVIGVSIFSVMGTKMAVNSINRNAQDALVYAQQQANNRQMNATSVIDDVELDVDTNESKQWSDEQVKWMQENHITYNENGEPVDEDGNVVVDPTVSAKPSQTKTDSIADVTSSNKNSNKNEESDKTPIEKPETNTDWAAGKDWLTQSDNGDYKYVISYGDTLNKLCGRTGFSLNEIVEYNNISNPDLIHVGQVIVFPQAGPNGTANNTNLGLG